MMKKKMIVFILTVAMFATLFPILGSAQSKVLPQLLNPERIVVDDTSIYIAEGASIFIFDKKSLKLKKKFGKKGEGPQEFMKHPQIALLVDASTADLTVNCMSRISYFDKSGVFKRAIKTPFRAGYYLPFGSGYVGIGQPVTQGADITSSICLFDSQVKKTATLTSWKRPPVTGKIRMLEASTIYRVYKGNVYLTRGGDFNINVFNPEGKKSHSITKDFKRIKVTEKHKEQIKDFFRKDPRFRAYIERFLHRLEFADYFPAIWNFFVDNDKIYALTYKKNDKGWEWWVMDLKGNNKTITHMPLKMKDQKELFPFTLYDGVLYQMVETEDEEWALTTYAVK